LVLYDTRTNQAHVLNRTAAVVWKRADGRRTLSQLTRIVAQDLNAAPDRDLVLLALAQLSKAGLLDASATLPMTPALTRREFLQKATLAAAAIPVVKTISTLDPQQIASCVPEGGACLTNEQCCDCFCNVFECDCCFVGGTQVLYCDGTRRPIETVNIGDLVLARDEHTGIVAPQLVEKTYVHYDREAFTLDFGTSALGVTATHPFYTDSGWLNSSELCAGMDCYLDDGSRLTIQNIKHPLAQKQTVYNLEVANFHTYFVGAQGIWVHNKG
jgi:hypothetical protein